ncbi:MAG: peptidoglycan-binding protein [Pseudomonadota bacterium]
MKGFLIFATLLVLICGAFYGGYVIMGRDRTQEVRMVGALKLAQQEINKRFEATETQLFSPDFKVVPDRDDRWTLTGIATSTKATGERGEGPFSAILINICKQFDDPECWKISDLKVDQKIRAAKAKDQKKDDQEQAAAEENPESAEETAAAKPSAEEAAESNTSQATEPLTSASTASSEGEAQDNADAGSDPTKSDSPDPDALESVAQVVAKLPEVTVPDASPPSPPEPDFSDLSQEEIIKQVQASLTKLGYEPGPSDGKMGPKTQSAIRAYQADQGLQTDGEASPLLLTEITKTLADNQ